MKTKFKIFILLFSAFILFIGCTPQKHENNDTDTTTNFGPNVNIEKVLKIPFAISDDNFVNIRNAPSNDGEILDKITYLGCGVILGTEDDWYIINSGENTGYCYSKYIGYRSWYDGTGIKRLVAVRNCPVYWGNDKKFSHPVGTVPSGTIIGDRFENNEDNNLIIVEGGDSYMLNTAFDFYWKVKKSDVQIEK